MTPRKLKVYIADDHTLFRKGMVNLLSTFSNIGEIKDAENGKELLNLVKNDRPDVVIVDLQMPVMNGIDTCEALLHKYPSVKIIVLTMFDAESYILHMIEMGVHAFLLKNAQPEELEKAVDRVIENDFYHNELIGATLRRSVREKMALQRPFLRNVDLSGREREILSLICKELTIREIGVKLSISENTVRNHRVRIMDKVGVKNTVGLVKFAYETGLIN
jgi:DNA-binding NarL/FixJ family response regulator